MKSNKTKKKKKTHHKNYTLSVHLHPRFRQPRPAPLKQQKKAISTAAAFPFSSLPVTSFLKNFRVKTATLRVPSGHRITLPSTTNPSFARAP